MRVLVLVSALCASVVVCVFPRAVRAQETTVTSEKPWYDRISMRGYAQFRYNRLLETNEKLKCLTCDRSIGENGGFFLRRARLSISGQVSDRLVVDIHTDFSSEIGGRENTVVLRHYYADWFFDSAKTFKARFGQSEVPAGYESLQSSSRRAPFDRADAIESAAPGEQDLGVFVFWTPLGAKKLFRDLATSRLKGSGDFGVFAFGVMNGQGGNRAEANDAPHVIARLAYPFKVGKQFMEVDAQAFTGTYTIGSGQRAAGVGGASDFSDRRAGGTLVLYPQPIGLQAEWTFGRGPEYDAATNSIVERPLRGGYAMLSYAMGGATKHRVHAYARGQYFKGAFKTDPDARSAVVHELEPGIEWQIEQAFEVTAAYTISDRHYRDSAAPDNHQHGQFLRLQAQFSF